MSYKNPKKRITREVITQATFLENEMDHTNDPKDYNDILDEYTSLLDEYNLFEPIAESEDTNINYDDNNGIIITNGKYGIKKTCYHDGLPTEYDLIEFLEKEEIYLVHNNNKIGLIEQSCIEDGFVFDIVYDDIKCYTFLSSQRQFILKKDNKYIYFCNGRTSPEEFEDIIFPKFAGWIEVSKDGKQGWLDGNLNFTTSLEKAHEYYFPYICKERGERKKLNRELLNKCSEYNKMLRHDPTIEQEYENLSSVLTDEINFTIFEENGKFGLKDFLDFVVVEPCYYNIEVENPSKYAEELQLDDQPTLYGENEEGKWNIICIQNIILGLAYYSHLNGNIAIYPNDVIICNTPFVFDTKPKYERSSIYPYSIITINGKKGIFNFETMEINIKPTFDVIEEFYDCVLLQKDGKWGFVNSTIFIPIIYDRILPGKVISFTRFVRNNQIGYIDKDGNWTPDINKAQLYTCDPFRLEEWRWQ